MTDLRPIKDASSLLDWFPHEMLINGNWQSAADDGSIDVLDPSTGESVATVPNGTIDDAMAAVDAAAAALPSWSATSPRERSNILRKAFELMSDRADDIARLIVLENGKALADARGEVSYAAEFFRWYSEESVRLLGSIQTAPGGANRIVVNRLPIGVSVLVTPWNFPAAMATRKIGPALAAGCTVILKPASDTPLTALAIGSILMEAGVPPGVVNVIPSKRSGPVVGTMLDDPRIRKLSFTGSTEVGRTLLQAAAKSVVSCSMELGGNAPFIVFDDANIDDAVDGAMVAKMRNGGSACTAANRLYVHESVAAEFSQRLADRMGALKLGSGSDDTVELGPLINAASQTKVADLVDRTVALGAKVLTGGHTIDRPGYFYPATVLMDVPADAPVLSEEIFGPVAPIVTFTDEDDVIDQANATEYGLVAYIYTTDIGRGMRVSERLESGMVGINRGVVSDPAAPFGGVKQSGVGREGGHEGMLEFTESQYVAVSW